MVDSGFKISSTERALEIVSIAAKSSLDFLDAVFDCYRRGQVFVINRSGTRSIAGQVHLREIPLSSRPKFGWGRFQCTPRLSDAPAQIVFTSGTEGTPKPIVLSHRNLADVVARLNDVMEVTDEIREYVGVPVTYSFGLGRARAIAAAGGEIYLPERFDPSEIRAMLDAGEINAISAVPSLWRAVLTAPEAIGGAGGAVRWIEIGSQYMSGAEKAAMKELFPNAKIVQHYGLTEASRTTFLDISTCDEKLLESVGRTTGQLELRIADEGAICIRGPHVAIGRLEDSGMIAPLTDAEGWLVTKDRGELRNGYLYFLGRLDDQINVSGIKVAAEAVERDIAGLCSGMEGAFAVTSVPDRLRGEAVLLAISEPFGDRAAILEAASKAALARCGLPATGVLKVLHVAELPRTRTGKIRRGLLRRLYIDRDDADIGRLDSEPRAFASPMLSETERALANTWRKVMGPIDIQSGHTFYDAGGDSLSSVQIGLVMEAAGYNRAAVRATLKGRALRDVARAAGEPSVVKTDAAIAETALPERTAKSWAVSLARGVMVLSVLSSHWGQGLFGRLGILDFTERTFSIFYRMGTPGFAAVFGIGVGAFLLPGFFEKKASALRRARSSFWLVLAGISIQAAVDLVLRGVGGKPIDSQAIAFSLYSVLAYYALAFGLAPLWLPLLARIRRPLTIIPFLALVAWLCWPLATKVISPMPQTNLLEWPRLMSIAGYNVFKMSAVALAGSVVGLWLGSQSDAWHAGRRLIVWGALGSMVCLFVLLQSHGLAPLTDRFSSVFVSLPGLLFYVFVAMVLVGGFLVFVANWHVLRPVLRGPLKILIVFGGLALPIYVFHGIVIPVKDIFVLQGIDDTLALALPMGAFLTAMTYGGWRLYRMYFG